MTALAMILGMIPMSLGLGSGGEQNAPLGRAVIGGLLFATVSTLFLFQQFSACCTGVLSAAARSAKRATTPRGNSL
jgi:Cu/Ag efflux pump CusA